MINNFACTLQNVCNSHEAIRKNSLILLVFCKNNKKKSDLLEFFLLGCIWIDSKSLKISGFFFIY